MTLLLRNTVIALVSIAVAATGSLGFSVALGQAAHATTLTCGTAAENVAALRSALLAAQDDRIAAIDLAPGCTYLLTDADSSGLALLPTVNGIVIIHGNGATITRDASAPAKPIFLLTLSTADLRLDAVTLTGGKPAIVTYSEVTIADSTLSANNGVVNSFGGDVTITSSDVTANPWPTPLSNSGGTMTITDSNVSHNQQAGACGGGVAVSNVNGGLLDVAGSTFQGNRGCVFTFGTINNGSGSTTVVEDSSFVSNQATYGGAIENAGTLSVTRSVFRGNSATAGGAVRSTGGTITISETLFDANQGATSGGALQLIQGATSISASTVSGNSSQEGAGIYFGGADATLTMVNSTFGGNVARRVSAVGSGGGLYANGGTATLTHTTFTRNRALDFGRGSAIFNAAGSVTVVNSLIDPQSGGPACSGDPLVDGGHNLGCGWGSSSFSLLPLTTATGGPTPTAALAPGSSAAVDAVPAASCPGTDQRGVVRPQAAACDIGAWEDQPPGVPTAPALSGATSPTTGAFTLSWPPVVDPDGTPVTYELWHQDADDSSFAKVVSTAGTSHVFTTSGPEAEGTFSYRVVATDGNLARTSPAMGPVVVDRSGPPAPGASADRAPEHDATGTADDWYRDSVTVTFTPGTDPDLPDGSAGSGTAFTTPPVVLSTSGRHQVAGSSADVAGNLSATSYLDVQVDAEPPVVTFDTCPSTVELDATTEAAWSATDESSGLAGPSGGSVPLPATTVGTHTVSTPNVSDNVGHGAAAECTYRVVYAFQGFFPPVANPPDDNVVSAGRQVTVGFSLGGDQGLDVLATGYPQMGSIACGSTALLETGDPLATSGLSFTRGGEGRYSFSFRVERSWVGSCRQLVVKLDDGTYHRAVFRVR